MTIEEQIEELEKEREVSRGLIRKLSRAFECCHDENAALQARWEKLKKFIDDKGLDLYDKKDIQDKIEELEKDD